MKWLDPQTLFAKPFCASLVECVRVAILNEKEAFFWKSLLPAIQEELGILFFNLATTRLAIHYNMNISKQILFHFGI